METAINDSLIEKLNNLGFNIPKDLKFKLLNNKEEHEAKEDKTALDQAVATVVKTMSDSGYEVDDKWITEQTGIPLKKKEIVKPMTQEFKNKLEETYGRI